MYEFLYELKIEKLPRSYLGLMPQKIVILQIFIPLTYSCITVQIGIHLKKIYDSVAWRINCIWSTSEINQSHREEIIIAKRLINGHNSMHNMQLNQITQSGSSQKQHLIS